MNACRPLGSSVLMGAYDKNGPQLYALDPLGTCLRYFGAAVGKGRQVGGVARLTGDAEHVVPQCSLCPYLFPSCCTVPHPKKNTHLRSLAGEGEAERGLHAQARNGEQQKKAKGTGGKGALGEDLAAGARTCTAQECTSVTFFHK
eukprot:1160716-Pelagomonas_calceolata.AAC.9